MFLKKVKIPQTMNNFHLLRLLKIRKFIQKILIKILLNLNKFKRHKNIKTYRIINKKKLRLNKSMIRKCLKTFININQYQIQNKTLENLISKKSKNLIYHLHSTIKYKIRYFKSNNYNNYKKILKGYKIFYLRKRTWSTQNINN